MLCNNNICPRVKKATEDFFFSSFNLVVTHAIDLNICSLFVFLLLLCFPNIIVTFIIMDLVISEGKHKQNNTLINNCSDFLQVVSRCYLHPIYVTKVALLRVESYTFLALVPALPNVILQLQVFAEILMIPPLPLNFGDIVTLW